MDLALYEISDAAEIITQEAAEHANIIVGSVVDESLQDEIIVTVIATGFLEQEVEKKASTVAFQPAVEEIKKEREAITPRVVPSEPMQQKAKIETSEPSEYALKSEINNASNDLDIPTFMRQIEGPAIEE